MRTSRDPLSYADVALSAGAEQRRYRRYIQLVLAAVRRRMELRAAEAELHELDPRILKDIGLDRSEIRSVLIDCSGERRVRVLRALPITGQDVETQNICTRRRTIVARRALALSCLVLTAAILIVALVAPASSFARPAVGTPFDSLVARPQADGAIDLTADLHIATIHAEGAQVYQCRPDAAGRLSWHFREPIATLLDGAETVGRHYAGPSWELADGTTLSAKVVARAPGATSSDIPWLWLSVGTVKGRGPLATATTMRRVNTKGGVAEGPCVNAGAFLNVPYSADYTFFKGRSE